jgi:hypothetical protein
MKIATMTSPAPVYTTEKTKNSQRDGITFEEYADDMANNRPRMAAMYVDGVRIEYNMWSKGDQALTPELAASLREKYANTSPTEAGRMSFLADLVNAGVVSGGWMMMQDLSSDIGPSFSLSGESVATSNFDLPRVETWASWRDYFVRQLKELKSVFNIDHLRQDALALKNQADRTEKLIEAINSVFGLSS